MAALGSLVVSLEANMASFRQDMSKAATTTEQAMGKINGAARVAAAGLAALGVGAIATGFVGMIKSAIDAADHLNDLSKATGITVEDLSGLKLLAAQTGTDLDVLAKGINKMSVEMGKSPEKFKALGVTAKDNVESFKQLSDIFNRLTDINQRNALAQSIFGKSWQELAPVLSEGGKSIGDVIEKGKRLSGVTQEMAQRADEFNDKMAELKAATDGAKMKLAGEMLPALTDIVTVITHTYEESGKLAAIWASIGSLGAFIFTDQFASDASKIKKLREQLKEFEDEQAARQKESFTGLIPLWLFGSDAGLESNIAEAKAQLKVFEDKIEKVKKDAAEKKGAEDKTKENLAKQKEAAAKAAAFIGLDAAQKKAQLDGRIKTIENALAQERDVLKFHDEFVSELRAQDLIDQKAYDDYRMASIAATLESTLRNYDAEIAAIQKYKATLSEKAQVQEQQNKISELNDKKEKARQDAIQKSEMLTLGLSRAQSELNFNMKEWVVQQQQAASQFQFEIDMMGKSSLEVQKLTAARRIQLDVEEQIRQAKKRGDISDESIAKIQAEAAIAKASISSLYDQADAMQKDPWFNASESIRKYGEEAANTGAQIGEVMTRSFKSAEDALTNFLMTGKLDFKSFANSVISDLIRIQARKLVAGIGSGIFGLFGSGATALDGTTLTAGNAIDFAGQGFADGGEPPVGVPSMVGERGPELFIPKQSGTIVPNHALGGTSVNYAPVINIDSRTDRAEIYAMVSGAVQQGNIELTEKLSRAGKLRS